MAAGASYYDSANGNTRIYIIKTQGAFDFGKGGVAAKLIGPIDEANAEGFTLHSMIQTAENYTTMIFTK